MLWDLRKLRIRSEGNVKQVFLLTNLSNTVMSFGFVLFIILATFSKTNASPASVTPGPRQVCTCFPPDTPDVCPGTDSSGKKPGKPPALEPLQCTQKISMKISFVADNAATLFICSKLIQTTHYFGMRADIFYTGGCGDLIFFVPNFGGPMGLSVLVDVNGKRYGTTERSRRFRKSGTRPLYGITKFEPSGEFFTNPSSFDFSSWTNAVAINLLKGDGFVDFVPAGAFPIGFRNDDVPDGAYGLRIKLPFCR